MFEDFFVLYADKEVNTKKNCIIPSGNKYKIAWDMWVLLLLLFISLVVPVRLAFVEEDSIRWILIYSITDTCFLIDIILTFNTSISDEKRVYELTDKREIARRYLRGWFWIDTISIIPLDFMMLADSNNATILARFAKIGKLYKLIRMIRLAKVLKLLRS